MAISKLKQYHDLAAMLLDQYRVVDRAVTMVVGQNDPGSSNESLETINQLLAGVKETESKIKPLRDELVAANATLPEATQKVIDETVQIVTSLIPRIGALEKEAVEARERLSPAIHEGVRAAKMKSAYAKQHVR